MKAGNYILLTKCKRLRYRRYKSTAKDLWKHVSIIDYISIEMANNEEKFFFSLFHQTSKKTR
jgi:hypothetical protein